MHLYSVGAPLFDLTCFTGYALFPVSRHQAAAYCVVVVASQSLAARKYFLPPGGIPASARSHAVAPPVTASGSVPDHLFLRGLQEYDAEVSAVLADGADARLFELVGGEEDDAADDHAAVHAAHAKRAASVPAIVLDDSYYHEVKYYKAVFASGGGVLTKCFSRLIRFLDIVCHAHAK